jgi:hypothetical protein
MAVEPPKEIFNCDFEKGQCLGWGFQAVGISAEEGESRKRAAEHLALFCLRPQAIDMTDVFSGKMENVVGSESNRQIDWF